MENALSFLENSIAALIFCLAAYLLLLQSTTMNTYLNSTKNVLDNSQIVYEQPLEELNENQVTYAEIITSLLSDISCDIQINNTVISKDNFIYQNYDFSIIPKGDYTKSYEYDSSGNISKVIYTLYQG